MKKILPIVAVLVLAGVGAYLYMRTDDEQPGPVVGEEVEEEPMVITGQPTDFIEAGIAVINMSGLKPGVLYLMYENPDAPAVTKELSFDSLSVCATETGATPCLAMSSTLDIPFGGKKVMVEGNEQGSALLVRKLRRLQEGEVALIHEPGRIFIPWSQAVELIKKCQVSMVMQTHSLDVMLLLKKDDTEVVAVEPTIDAVFPIVQEANCPDVAVATE